MPGAPCRSWNVACTRMPVAARPVRRTLTATGPVRRGAAVAAERALEQARPGRHDARARRTTRCINCVSCCANSRHAAHPVASASDTTAASLTKHKDPHDRVHDLPAAQNLDAEQGKRGAFRQHQPPCGRCHAREGAAGRTPSAAAVFAGDAQWRQGDGDAGGTAGSWGTRAPNTTRG